MSQTNRGKSLVAFLLLVGFAGVSAAASDRVTRPVDANRTRVLSGHVHPLAQSQFDRGVADPAMLLDHVMLMIKPSAAQQAALDQLLVDQ